MKPAPSRTRMMAARLRVIADESAYKPGPICGILDTREGKPAAIPEAIPVIVKKLDVGDISLVGAEHRFTLDRKSLDDFNNCFTWARPRFERMLEKMKAFEFAAILIEASLSDVYRRRYRAQLTPAQIVGAAASIAVRYGVPVYFCGDHAGSSDLAYRLMLSFYKHHMQVEAVTP